MQEASLETNDLPGHCRAIQTKARLRGSWGGQKEQICWVQPSFWRKQSKQFERSHCRARNRLWNTNPEHPSQPVSSSSLYSCFPSNLSFTLSANPAHFRPPHPWLEWFTLIFFSKKPFAPSPAQLQGSQETVLRITEVKLTLPCLSDLLLTQMCNDRHSPAWCSYCIKVRRNMKNLATRAPPRKKSKQSHMTHAEKARFFFFFFNSQAEKGFFFLTL